MIIAPSLQLSFNILYEATTARLPSGITFNLEYFVRPGHITIPILLTNLTQNNMSTPNIPTYPPTILDEYSNQYPLRTVDLNHLYT